MRSILSTKRVLGAVGWCRLLPVLALFFTSQVTQAQTVTLAVANAPLKEVFDQIKEQTGYSFIYASEFLIDTHPVSFSVRRSNLKEVLELCFKSQPVTYLIQEKFIIIKKREKEEATVRRTLDLRGRVINEKGQGIGGATVAVKGSVKGTATDSKGAFLLNGIKEGSILKISSIGYALEEVPVEGRPFVTVPLRLDVQLLDETIIKGYYTTNKRLNTGSVAKIKSDDIGRQPVLNPLQALQGRVPGLEVSQSNGLPGSAVTIQIRGRNSIAQGSEPLFVIDGVPLATGNTSLSQIFSAMNANAGVNGISPFQLINPADIESIEILKDADATSIYGSRGANGVILISTKQGETGTTKIDLNFYNGFSKLTRTMDLLTTQQYLQMRREAFVNDKALPDHTNGYDLLVWDTTRYTDFKKMLIGGTAATRDVQASVSGGSTATRFLLGGSYHHETTVFPGDFSYNRGTTHFSINHASENKRFTIDLLGYYSFSGNNTLTTDLSGAVNAVPNLPSLYDSSGRLRWNEKGIGFVNPLSFLKKTYSAKTNLLNTNLRLDYNIRKGLSIAANLGFNRSEMDEVSTNPIASQNPAVNATGSSSFGNAVMQGWIIEPQLKYSQLFGPGKIEVQTGGTLQKNTHSGTLVKANGYTNDNLLKDANAAAAIKVSDDYNDYKYQALFGRLNYNWKDRYILNLACRRDGSSRFGPHRQFANFGSVGFAWIFSNEARIKNKAGILSFGKLRGSYGSSGNDQIGNYKYLSAWTTTRYPYQGSSGLYPNNLFNPDYSWEINRKLEMALELGLWKNKVFFTVSYFRNRSSNQLVSYQLPYQTGFFDITRNFPALVQNTGFEVEVLAQTIRQDHFSWSTSVNLTVPKNTLTAFPEIETSSYSYLVVGQPLTVYGGFHFLGVEPQSGIYQFADKEGKPISFPSTANDYIKSLGHLDARFYGGISNSFSYKSVSLNVFLEVKKQTGANYLNFLTSNMPGTITNQFTNVLDRWQKPGDVSAIQQFTQDPGSAASQAAGIFRLYGNDAKYSDASYIRVKNIFLSYDFSHELIRKLHLGACHLYLQAQNLLTITSYLGADPETKNMLSLPPLKTFTAGIQIGF